MAVSVADFNCSCSEQIFQFKNSRRNVAQGAEVLEQHRDCRVMSIRVSSRSRPRAQRVCFNLASGHRRSQLNRAIERKQQGRKSPAAPTTRCDRNLSPPKVTSKREFLRVGPEAFGRFSPELPFSGDLRLAENARTPIKKAGFSPRRCTLSLVEGVGGWGGRDRTSEWRNQNPVNSRVRSISLLNFPVPFTR